MIRDTRGIDGGGINQNRALNATLPYVNGGPVPNGHRGAWLGNVRFG